MPVFAVIRVSEEDLERFGAVGAYCEYPHVIHAVEADLFSEVCAGLRMIVKAENLKGLRNYNHSPVTHYEHKIIEIKEIE